MNEFDDSESWVCGDCGTQYGPEILECKNQEFDRFAIARYNAGRMVGRAEMQKELGQPVEDLLDAMELLTRYNLGIHFWNQREKNN